MKTLRKMFVLVAALCIALPTVAAESPSNNTDNSSSGKGWLILAALAGGKTLEFMAREYHRGKHSWVKNDFQHYGYNLTQSGAARRDGSESSSTSGDKYGLRQIEYTYARARGQDLSGFQAKPFIVCKDKDLSTDYVFNDENHIQRTVYEQKRQEIEKIEAWEKLQKLPWCAPKRWLALLWSPISSTRAEAARQDYHQTVQVGTLAFRQRQFNEEADPLRRELLEYKIRGIRQKLGVL
jgi:hypothetical protein